MSFRGFVDQVDQSRAWKLQLAVFAGGREAFCQGVFFLFGDGWYFLRHGSIIYG